MAEMKKEKRESKMYDHPGSKKAMGGEHKSEKPKKEEKSEAAPKEKEAEAPAKAEGKPMHERHSEDRSATHKRHEVERRDMHGNHRDEKRKMDARHEKEMKDMAAAHEAEMASGGGLAAPAAEAAPAAAPVAAAAPAGVRSPCESMKSMELDDEDKIDAITPIAMPDRPDYPYGLRITLTDKELDKLGLDHSAAEVGGTIHGFFMARITSVSENEVTAGEKCCRIELQIEDLGIESEDEENQEASHVR